MFYLPPSTCPASISCPKASNWLRNYFVILFFRRPYSILFEGSSCRLCDFPTNLRLPNTNELREVEKKTLVCI